MTPARIHFPSILAGAGAITLVLGLVSMMQAPSHLPPFQILGVPTPEQMTMIHQMDTPYTVPADKRYVATGVYQGGTVGSFAVTILFDAKKIIRLSTGNEIAPGLAAAPGTVITFEVGAGGGDTLLLGYLADA